MKRCLNRILSSILVVSISITTFLYFYIPAYAKPYYTWEEVRKDATTSIFYVVSQLKAATNGDFSSYVQGLDAWENYWNEDNVSIDGQEISYSPEFIAMIKQALIEYSEETNGFWLVPTININSIPLEYFPTKQCYDNLRSIIGELEVAAVANNGVDICALGSYLEDLNLSLVYNATINADFDPYRQAFPVYLFSNKTWLGPFVCGPSSGSTTEEIKSFPYIKHFAGDCSIMNIEGVTWADGVTGQQGYNSQYRNAGPFCFSYDKDKAYTDLSKYNPTHWSSYGSPRYAVWSIDGRRMKIYKSQKAFLYGMENERTVYFAKDFYDTTPTQITVSFDEMKDTVDKLDGVLNDLLDKIDSTTDENTIEDLLQQILDEMKNHGGGNQGGNQGGGNEGGGSYDDTGLLAVLSGYFDSVLAYLDQILSAIDALVWIEVDDSTVTEGDKDLFDLIDKIWENPETGSQEAADKLSGSFLDIVKGMTKKFPFSIPWDIHALFSVFARAGQSQPETAMLADGYGIMPLVGEPDDGEYDYPNGDGTSTVINWDDNPHDAPYFVLPLVVESYGIEEYIEVDLKDFQTVSTLSRSLLAVLFAVFLIKFTISLMEFFRGGD